MDDTTRMRTAAGDATRTALVAAAVAAIVEEGWQNAGSRSVTARAAVPLGALNYHFGTKEVLFRSAAGAEVVAMFATPWRVIAGSGTVADLVDGLVGWSRSSDVTDVQRDLLLEVMAQSRRDPELGALLAVNLERYRGAVADALLRLRVVTGPSAAAEADVLAAAFTATLNGMWLQGIVEPAVVPAPVVERTAAIWRAALDPARP